MADILFNHKVDDIQLSILKFLKRITQANNEISARIFDSIRVRPSQIEFIEEVGKGKVEAEILAKKIAGF